MTRVIVTFLVLIFAGPAFAQTAEEVGQMRLYIQQLEDRVRQLTGENERLAYELNQIRAQTGQAPLPPAPAATGAVTVDPLGPGAPPSDLGSLSVSPGDPLIAPDGLEEAPVDLSTLAGGVAGELMDPVDPTVQTGVAVVPPAGSDVAALPGTPAPATALSGSPRDEYDLAYGYVLTGDYDLAEASFKSWLVSFPEDAQAADAQFWLGESHLQQGEYREAANAFLALYNSAPQSPKGPDALLKLGASLSALGEKVAACATFTEVGRKYPQASEPLLSRVRDEAGRAGC